MTDEIITHVRLSEFREKVFRALPTYPYGITLADLTQKVYGGYDAKKDKGRRNHVMKALNDLWRLKIAYHETERVAEKWKRTKYSRTRRAIVVERWPAGMKHSY